MEHPTGVFLQVGYLDSCNLASIDGSYGWSAGINFMGMGWSGELLLLVFHKMDLWWKNDLNYGFYRNGENHRSNFMKNQWSDLKVMISWIYGGWGDSEHFSAGFPMPCWPPIIGNGNKKNTKNMLMTGGGCLMIVLPLPDPQRRINRAQLAAICEGNYAMASRALRAGAGCWVCHVRFKKFSNKFGMIFRTQTVGTWRCGRKNDGIWQSNTNYLLLLQPLLGL